MVEAPVQIRPRYTQGRCARCGAFELHRSQTRGPVELVLKLLSPLVPMRCPACGHRSLRLPAAARLRAAAPPQAEAYAPESRRVRRRRRRLRKRLRAVAWVLGATAAAAVLGYIASIG